MSLTVVATVFALIVPAELPDKTFVATLVLATRFRAVPVLIGAAAGFIVQAGIAVGAGSVLDLLPEPSTLRVVLTSFVVLFVAEWGDLTQLLTASLAAKYHDPFSVFLGSSLGLITVGALGVTGGKAMLRVIPMHWVRRIAAAAFAAVATVTALQAAGVL
jgi:putative Ca2+/H+ antiporter (TMEM165/GDT1 family)